VPLVLNVVAALWVVRLLAPDLSFLRPSRRRPLDVAAVAAVVVAVLHLPGIVFVGMEHTLHLALVLAAVLAAERRWARPADAARGRAVRERGPAARSPSCASGSSGCSPGALVAGFRR
jgi:hypothetical protein